ncbi:unnamed protein product [Urochloa humidicola]
MHVQREGKVMFLRSFVALAGAAVVNASVSLAPMTLLLWIYGLADRDLLLLHKISMMQQHLGNNIFRTPPTISGDRHAL